MNFAQWFSIWPKHFRKHIGSLAPNPAACFCILCGNTQQLHSIQLMCIYILIVLPRLLNLGRPLCTSKVAAEDFPDRGR